MAAPSATARQSPGGIMLRDGYQSLITFSLDPDISLSEKTTTPPELDGGEPIPQSTMHNVDWHTFYPRQLVKLGDSSYKCAYDPYAYGQIFAILNIPQTITHKWGDGTTIAYFGWVGKATPAEQQEGVQPEMTVMIHASMYDKTNDVEAGYTLADGSGT